MKKRKALELPKLVQEIEMVIDDWYFTKCPHNEMYKSNGELKNEYL